MTYDTKLRTVTLRTERWNKGTLTYEVMREMPIMVKVTKHYYVNRSGQKFDRTTGKSLDRFYPGQRFRWSIKLDFIEGNV